MQLDRFINRPVLSTVISVVIVILGILGLVSLPVSQYPDIAPPTIQVSTTYTGANAQTVLNSVIAPLEEQINGVENMDYMSSTATNTGSASINITFKQGTDPDMAAVNVQNRVSKALGLLPSEVTQVGVITQKRQSSMLIIFSIVDKEDKYDASFIENYAKINIIPQVQRVKGVGDAMVMGADYSMRIWLDPQKMAEYHMMPGDITAVLAEQNIEAAPGSIGERENQTFQYTLRYRGRLSEVPQFENMVIRSNPDGTIIRVKEVARFEMGRSSYAFSGKVNGHKSVTCMVMQVAGSNATQIITDIQALLKNCEKDLPEGIGIMEAQNVNDFLFASIHEVIKTLIEAFILVFIVVYIFLQDFRSTLIPAIAIPVALIGTFFALYIIGFSINLLTLSALVLAIAIVVDDAIVVVEAVHAKLDQGYKSALTASIDAMNEITGAIISITLVMAAVFVPVSFMGGTSGVFYREFGVTMAVSILISAVNALTLSPALCAIFLKPHEGEHEKKMSVIDRFHAGFNYQYEKILEKYKKGVANVIHHRVLAGVAVAVGILAMCVTMATTKTGLVPDEDTGVIFCTVSMAPGTSQERTKVVIDQIDKMLANNPAIKNREQLLGYNFIAGQGSDQATFIVKLKSFEDRPAGFFYNLSGLWQGDGIMRFFVNPMSYTSVLGMIYKQTAEIKDAQILAFAPPMISGFGATNGITFSMQDKTGGDLNKFFEITKNYLAELNKRPEIATAMTSYNPNYPQYMVDVDVAKCKQNGISPQTVLSTLQGYYGGLYASNFNSYGKLYRVMIQGTVDSRKNPATLTNIYVRTPAGMAPISEYCSLRRVYGPSNVDRFNLFTCINVNATAATGYSSGQALQAVEEVAAQVLPTGYGLDYSGMTRSEQESSDSTAIIFALCLVFVYLILSAQYESYILPLAVILSIPFGLAGAFIFTNLFGHSNDIYMQIALIMLIGLLAKNAILIVQFALERRRTGMAIRYSAILGAGARLRPILMTSLAMIIGLLPLMFASGVGKNGNQTLGAAAVGGMLIGTLCQLFIVPALFAVFQWLQEKVKPIEFDDDNAQVDTELLQYTHPIGKK